MVDVLERPKTKPKQKAEGGTRPAPVLPKQLFQSTPQQGVLARVSVSAALGLSGRRGYLVEAFEVPAFAFPMGGS